MNEHGQSLVETVAVLPVLIGFFMFVCGGCYALFAHAWIGYQLDQALFCAAQAEHGDCHKQTMTALHRFLPWGHVTLNLDETGSRAEAKWQWMNNQYRLDKTLKLDSRLWR